MKPCIKILFLLLMPLLAKAQQHLPDSTVKALKNASNDSLSFVANVQAYNYFEEINRDSSLYYAGKMLLLAEKNHKKLPMASAFALKGFQLTGLGRYAEALKNLLSAFSIAEDKKIGNDSWAINKQSTPEKSRLLTLAVVHHMFAILMDRTQNTEQLIFHFKEAKRIAVEIDNPRRILLADMNLGNTYLDLKRIDSALIFENEARDIGIKTGHKKFLSNILSSLGDITLKSGDKAKAGQFYYESVNSAKEQNNISSLTKSYFRLTDFYLAAKNKDSSLYFATKMLEALKTLGQVTSQQINVGVAYAELYKSYRLRNQLDSAFKYSELALVAKDSIYKNRIESLAQFQNLSFREQLRLQDLDKEKVVYESNIRIYALLAGLGVFLIIALILYRNNRQKHKANVLLNRQKDEIEAQAREAKIETALERVRSKTMAMHNSEDVGVTVATMFDELLKLGVETTVRCGVTIIDNTKQMEVWAASSTANGEATLTKGRLNMTIHPLLQNIFNAWKNKKLSTSYELVGQDLKDYYQAIIESPDYPFQHKIESLPEKQINNAFFFPEGCLFAFTTEPLSADAAQLFKKFAGVFGLTYRRFLDLQKAEAQAREAKIEVALERVRSRTMAMQKSDELKEVIQLVFEQLKQLNFNIDSASFGLDYKESDDFNLWLSSAGQSYPTKVHIPYVDIPIFNRFIEAKKNEVDFLTENYSFEEKNAFFDHFFKNVQGVTDERKEFVMATAGYARSTVLMKNATLTMQNYAAIPYLEEENAALRRFGKVFEQTYTRFLDLQKAEEQAREAKIEAALEKVRGKAMAMYNSKDLSATASMVFTELRKLGINPLRCGVGMASKGSDKVQLYSATTSADGDSLALMGWVKLPGHPVLEKILESILNLEDYFPVLKGKELKSYYEELLSGLSLPSVPDWETGNEQYGHFFPFPDGALYAWSEKPYNDAEIKILKRFASVIDLTFRRYIELQKSETNAREAVRQSSLDRVRAEIASMRTTTDLERITPLVWNELTHLGVPFIRCGVFIVDEELEQIHSYLSTPDGKAIAAFQLQFNAAGIGQTVLSNWRNKQPVIVHWNEEEFQRLSHTLVEQGAVESEEKYLTAHPPTSLDLHFFPFLQGMLYVGNTEPLTNDQNELVQSLADAFSTAYARYEDFNKLEEAKRAVENTLTELKAAQTRLIQSEKMASLGELTAGIAHEIQNPLNFVNNFSDVSMELLDEMETELNKGDKEEALAIAGDIRQNLEKINNHGKRADFIVKGMLQHSRTSTGERQPTNINLLADEFLKLSYHGLRAKDKSFNAEMVTHFEPDLPKINVVQQDIGRVLLNLFNNAFYAVSQKQKTAGADYKPEVTVSTSTENGQFIIKVTDNGTGIPEAIKEKIMQPFFTTKPTGEGTGLGLSLTYDMVVKGHGGSIKVNSIDGDGSEFIISLPFV